MSESHFRLTHTIHNENPDAHKYVEFVLSSGIY